MIDLVSLSLAASRGSRKAREAAAATLDVGSCSADMVHIPVGKTNLIKRRAKRIREVLERHGLVTERKSGFWRGYLIIPNGSGLASKRTAACVAMAKELSRYAASVYYARD